MFDRDLVGIEHHRELGWMVAPVIGVARRVNDHWRRRDVVAMKQRNALLKESLTRIVVVDRLREMQNVIREILQLGSWDSSDLGCCHTRQRAQPVEQLTRGQWRRPEVVSA